VVHYANRGADRARRRRLTTGVDLAGGGRTAMTLQMVLELTGRA
jgi:hypothetical protein